MSGTARHLAIDLGAGSGRALAGVATADGILLEELHRFSYAPRHAGGHRRWDMASLLAGLDTSLERAAAAPHAGDFTSVGVDTWGVDYGLVDEDLRLIEDPCTYRDARTDGVMTEVLRLVPAEELFSVTGVQFQQINTIYQLVAQARGGWPPRAHRLLMMPDLCHLHLCGVATGEETNASTTQLLEVTTRRWADDLFRRLGLPRSLMPGLVPAGTRLGPLAPARRGSSPLGALTVVAPATHDTASAVAGTPLEEGWAFISSGTWSLVGVERHAPLVTPAVRAANLTNEAGAFGTTRLLANVMGLWILDSCCAEWRRQGLDGDVGTLAARAAALDAGDGYIDPDAPRFLHPGCMRDEVRAALVETGQAGSDDPVRLTRVVLDSLACRYAEVVETLEAVTGCAIPGIHIVGGGSRNAWLNQATADASGRPVVAGPVEATAAGNVLVQAIAMGSLPSLAEGRRLVARAATLQRFEPRDTGRWREARQRFADIRSRGTRDR